MIKRLIFDIDGTLITGVSFDKAIRGALERVGALSDENVQKYISAIGTYEIVNGNYQIEKYLKHFSDALGIELDEEFLQGLFGNLARYAVPENNQELFETIDSLSKKYELVLLSNYFEQSQRGRLESMGIDRYFSEFHGEKVSKPDRQVYLDAIGNHKPSECIMIGDSLDLDIIAAKKFGLNTIWINEKGVLQNRVRTFSLRKVTDIDEKLINRIEKALAELEER